MEAKQKAREHGRSVATRALCWATLLIGLGGALAGEACSSSSTSASASSCEANPLQCGQGETCAVEKCNCPADVANCTSAACTTFDLQCLQSNGTATLGDSCLDEVGKATCGDGQWCVQEMNVNGGVGVCTQLCDLTADGACPYGYSCVTLGIGLRTSAPVVHVCEVTVSDAGLPIFSADAMVGGGGVDSALADGGSSDAPTIVTVVRN